MHFLFIQKKKMRFSAKRILTGLTPYLTALCGGPKFRWGTIRWLDFQWTLGGSISSRVHVTIELRKSNHLIFLISNRVGYGGLRDIMGIQLFITL